VPKYNAAHVSSGEPHHIKLWLDLETLALQHPELAKIKTEIERAIASRALDSHAVDLQREHALLRALRDKQGLPCGALIFRIFWWGFHIEIPSPELRIAATHRGDPALDFEPFALAVAALGSHVYSALGFLNVYSALLQQIDKGRGLYLMMLWNAPGLFLPSPIK
jgi:hypothetical protein